MKHKAVPAEAPRTGATRWWQRAVPVGLLAVAAGAAVVVLAPHDEVEASTTRERQSYLEVSLTAAPQQACRPAKAGRVATMPFRVTSHLGTAVPLTWQVVVDPRGPQPATVRDRGQVDLQPGATTEQRARVLAPRRAHDVRLVIPGRPESLEIHCGGTR